jgi:hypothetical protein
MTKHKLRQFAQHTTEWAIPYEQTKDCLIHLREWLEREPYSTVGTHPNFPIEIRFSAPDDIWLSPAYGRLTCWVGLIQYKCVVDFIIFGFPIPAISGSIIMPPIQSRTKARLESHEKGIGYYLSFETCDATAFTDQKPFFQALWNACSVPRAIPQVRNYHGILQWTASLGKTAPPWSYPIEAALSAF